MNTTTIIILIIALIVVGTVGGLLATKTWNPEWNPFEEKADKATQEMLSKAIDAVFEADTSQFEGAVELSGVMDQEPGQANITFSGGMDTSVKEESKGNLTVDINVNFPDAAFSGKMELIAFPEEYYLKIASLSQLPIPGLDPSMLSGLLNEWIQINKQGLEEMGIVPVVEQSKYKEFLADLVDLMNEHYVFALEKEMGKDTVKGQSTSHYLISIDKEGLKEIIPEYFNLLGEYGFTEQYGPGFEEEIEQGLEEIPQAIDDFWEKIDGIEFEVWIYEADNCLARVKFEKDFTAEQFSDVSKVQGNVALAADIQFFNFNQALEIQAPIDYKTIEEILSVLMGPYMEMYQQSDSEEMLAPEFLPNE